MATGVLSRFIACIMLSSHGCDGRYVLLQEAEWGYDVPRVLTHTPPPCSKRDRKYRHVPVGKQRNPKGSFPSM